MRSIIKLLQIMGFWSQPHQKRSITKPLCYTALFLLWLLLPEIIFIVRQQPTFAIIARNAVECLLIANVILLTLSTIVHQSKLEEAYDNVQFVLDANANNIHRDLQLTITFLETSTDRFFKMYIGFEVAITSIYSLANPILTFIQYRNNGELPTLHGILEADFYIFDFSSNVWLWLLVIIVGGISLFLLIIDIVSINSLHWSLIYHVTGLFKVVGQRLSHLSDFPDKKSQTGELVAIIKLHEVIFRSANLLENVLNLYMLVQFGTCIIMLCIALMVLILSIDDQDLLIKMILMLSYVLSHIMMYSLLGSELIDASASVADAVYDVPWYQWAVSEQRKVLFVLGRSQLLTALTTGKFFYINRDTFGMTLQTTFSYFTVMKQLYGE